MGCSYVDSYCYGGDSMKKYQWELTEDSENGQYFQKLVNMNTPEVLTLEQAAERLNELEHDIEILRLFMPAYFRKAADEHLAQIKKHKKVKEYLSQGFSPTETGMALNMSLEDVLKAKEQK